MNLRNYKSFSILILSVFLIISFYLFKIAKDFESLNNSKYFDSMASLHIKDLTRNIDSVEDLLTGLKAFYGSSTYVDRKEFNDFLTLLSAYTNQVYFTGWLPKVTPLNFDKLLKEAKADGLKQYSWKGKTKADPPFYPLYFGYPVEEKWQSLFGVVLSDLPEIKSNFEKHIATDKAFIIRNTTIDKSTTSFWAFTPIYKEGIVKPENHLGFVTALFSIDLLVDKLSINPKARNEFSIHFLEHDGGKVKTLYSEDLDMLAKATEHPSKQIEIAWANKKWVICVLPSKGYATGHIHWQPWVILLIGFMLSLGISRYIFVSGQRGTEIFIANERLQQEIEDHKKARQRADKLTENLTNLAARHKLFAEALKGTINGLIIIDIKKAGHPIIYVNPAFSKITGYNQIEALGKSWDILMGEKLNIDVVKEIEEHIQEGQNLRLETYCYKRTMSDFYCELTLYPVFDDMSHAVKNYVIIFDDISTRKQIEEERIDFERRASQTNKLESLGTLAAGIAHEINTPVQYVTDNVDFLSKSSQSIMTILTDIQNKIIENKSMDELREALGKIDYAFLSSELPESIAAAQEGILRVKEIVKAVKDFSRPPTTKKAREDLNKAIDGALVVARHHWKDCCKITKNLGENLPLVPCHLGEINQVLLNLIVNAVDATRDNDAAHHPEITITTSVTDGHFIILFEDNGSGVPPEITKKIFDPFFTTKIAGEGTGQGLAISKMIIEKNHGGKLELDSSRENTCFKIELPLV